jgi:hypothetical protein
VFACAWLIHLFSFVRRTGLAVPAVELLQLMGGRKWTASLGPQSPELRERIARVRGAARSPEDVASFSEHCSTDALTFYYYSLVGSGHLDAVSTAPHQVGVFDTTPLGEVMHREGEFWVGPGDMPAAMHQVLRARPLQTLPRPAPPHRVAGKGFTKCRDVLLNLRDEVLSADAGSRRFRGEPQEVFSDSIIRALARRPDRDVVANAALWREFVVAIFRQHHALPFAPSSGLSESDFDRLVCVSRKWWCVMYRLPQ